MSAIAMTKLSSKGQIVLPENIRSQMKLEVGNQFMVFAEGDMVILKIITPPKIQDLKEAMNIAHTAAKKARLKQEDVSKDIQAYRKSKKQRSSK